MSQLRALVWLTFWEWRKTLWGLLAFNIALGGVIWKWSGAQRELLAISIGWEVAFWLALLLGLFSLAGSVSRDREGSLQILLTKPLGQASYLLGRFLGSCLLALTYLSVMWASTSLLWAWGATSSTLKIYRTYLPSAFEPRGAIEPTEEGTFWSVYPRTVWKTTQPVELWKGFAWMGISPWLEVPFQAGKKTLVSLSVMAQNHRQVVRIWQGEFLLAPGEKALALPLPQKLYLRGKYLWSVELQALTPDVNIKFLKDGVRFWTFERGYVGLQLEGKVGTEVWGNSLIWRPAVGVWHFHDVDLEQVRALQWTPLLTVQLSRSRALLGVSRAVAVPEEQMAEVEVEDNLAFVQPVRERGRELYVFCQWRDRANPLGWDPRPGGSGQPLGGVVLLGEEVPLWNELAKMALLLWLLICLVLVAPFWLSLRISPALSVFLGLALYLGGSQLSQLEGFLRERVKTKASSEQTHEHRHSVEKDVQLPEPLRHLWEKISYSTVHFWYSVLPNFERYYLLEETFQGRYISPKLFAERMGYGVVVLFCWIGAGLFVYSRRREWR